MQEKRPAIGDLASSPDDSLVVDLTGFTDSSLIRGWALGRAGHHLKDQNWRKRDPGLAPPPPNPPAKPPLRTPSLAPRATPAISAADRRPKRTWRNW